MIEKCPNCSYSLLGLPVEYQCPECGLKYDRESSLFAEPRAWWKALVVVNVVLLVVSGVLWVWRGANSLEAPIPVLFVMMPILLISRKDVSLSHHESIPGIYAVALRSYRTGTVASTN